MRYYVEQPTSNGRFDYIHVDDSLIQVRKLQASSTMRNKGTMNNEIWF